MSRYANARDIGAPPEPGRPDMREACRIDLAKFALEYFPSHCHLPFTPDHLQVLRIMQNTIASPKSWGDLFAYHLPRGQGSTTMLLLAAVWALVYRHRKFVLLIGATTAAADGLLALIKDDLENNELLAMDFPDTCHAIRALNGIGRRADGQISNGKPTYLAWEKGVIRLPVANVEIGPVVRSIGITAGTLHGAMTVLPGERRIRPDLALIDSPVSDASTRNPPKLNEIIRAITHTVPGLSGPAHITPCVCNGVESIVDAAEQYPHWWRMRSFCRLQAGADQAGAP